MAAKIMVFGVGAVGGVYTFILDKAGADVTAVCRSNYDIVKQNGLTINSAMWGQVSVKPHVVRSPADATGPLDFIVLCSKATNPLKSPSTADIIRPAVGPSTAIVLAQNGIGIEDEYAEAFPQNVIISGSVYLPVTQVKPGVIEHGTLENFEIGTYPHDADAAAKEKAEDFCRLFRAGGATCQIFNDIQEARWTKLMLNASLNPITALTMLDDANFLRSSEAAEGLIKSVMLEIAATAQAKGYSSINEDKLEIQLGRSRKRLETGGVEPSMLTDVKNGFTLEVEPIIGNAVRIAKSVNVKTPTLDVIYALIKGRNYALGAR